jgi:hypothetical protein
MVVEALRIMTTAANWQKRSSLLVPRSFVRSLRGTKRRSHLEKASNSLGIASRRCRGGRHGRDADKLLTLTIGNQRQHGRDDRFWLVLLHEVSCPPD